MLDVTETQAPPAIQPQNDAGLEPALERLLLCNQMRELTGYHLPVTVKDAPQPRGVMAGIVRRIYGAGGGLGRKPNAWFLLRHILLDAGVLVGLRVVLCRGRIWRIARTTLGAMVRHAVGYAARYYALPPSGITAYVRCTDREDPLIRVCVLLRTMKRYGACVEFLMQRWQSGLPAEQTRQWLAFLLREIGDAESAERIAPPRSRREAPEGLDRFPRPAPHAATRSASRRLTYGLVMPTMYDSEVFRSALLSLIESDFSGQIVVVEDGHQPARLCEAFCQRLPVTYIKNPRWGGPTGAINVGIQHLAPETDVILQSHSDVLWPRRWFGQFDDAWDKVYDSGKVSIINLGYLQFRSNLDPVLNELFNRGRYDDLLWVLRTRQSVQPPMEDLQDLQNTDLGRLFGLGRDNWADRPAQLRLMAGRFSVGASYLMAAWRALGGFCLDMPYGNDLELQYHSCRNRQWSLWIANSPLIHLVSSDISRVAVDETAAAEHKRKNRTVDERFAQHTGWEPDHVTWTYFSETCIVYHQEIVDAVNELRFSDIDFIFDEFWERLQRKKLSSCELVWCRSRPTCKYV